MSVAAMGTDQSIPACRQQDAPQRACMAQPGSQRLCKTSASPQRANLRCVCQRCCSSVSAGGVVCAATRDGVHCALQIALLHAVHGCCVIRAIGARHCTVATAHVFRNINQSSPAVQRSRRNPIA
ncbi:hypothetical protein VDG09_15600 [Xanthomonas campestris pv. raphani]|uniref:hypothetical protein n=1 Tax=Xanthomonas campestris TaxID=339 RepID=UPI002B226891|nr:hypothetical protein [Xanthomonas campestris]MEA9829065.1 hypothetical protein [Xanthomonas campestris pv. raphani]